MSLDAHRALRSVAVGVLVAWLAWVGNEAPLGPGDWDYIWVGARAVWHGENPYAAVEREMRAGTMQYPLYYPATAPVLFAPLGALPRRLAVSIFTGTGMALLAWSLRARWQAWILISAPAIHAVLLGQWSPWLTAAAGIPWLGFVWAAKPTTGLALFAGWPSRPAAIGMALLAAITFMLLPGWVGAWLESVRGAPQYLAPIQRPGGVLLLLAWLRWRRPEGRLLGTLAIVPHTTGLHEMLALLLVPKRGWELALLQGLGYVAAYLVYTRTHYGTHIVPQMLADQWPYFLCLMYLPALALVLRGARPASTGNRALVSAISGRGT